MKNISLTHKLAALASTAMLLTNILSAGIASADNATATLSSGGLSISASTITLSGTASTAASAMTGSTTISMSDLRGTAAGWTASSTVTDNFNLQGSSVTMSETSAGSISATGQYTADTCQSGWTQGGTTACGRVQLKVETVASGVPQLVDIWAASNATATPTTNDAAVTAGAFSYAGLTFTFTGTWTAGQYVSAFIDYLPTTGTTNSTGLFGSGTLTAGTGYFTTGITTNTSTATYYVLDSARADITAPQGTGVGTYSNAFTLGQEVHGSPVPGSYVATMTFSIASA